MRKFGAVLVLTLAGGIPGPAASWAAASATTGVRAVTAGNPAARAQLAAREFPRRAAGAQAAPGGQLWSSRYNGPGNSVDQAYSVAVSPGGGTVYVTGESVGSAGRLDCATIAHDAATGAQLWAAFAVAVSPTSGTVFVTGESLTPPSDWDYATVAYHP